MPLTFTEDDFSGSSPLTFSESDFETKKPSSQPSPDRGYAVSPIAPAPTSAPPEGVEDISSIYKGTIGPEIPRHTEPGKNIVQTLGHAADDTAAGLVNAMQTPQFATEATGLATPLAPVVLAKWGYDMAKSGIHSLGEIKDELTSMARDAVNRQFSQQNPQLGYVPPMDEKTKNEHVQNLVDNAMGSVVGLVGGGTALGHAAVGAVGPMAERFRKPETPTINITGRDLETLSMTPEGSKPAPIQATSEKTGVDKQVPAILSESPEPFFGKESELSNHLQNQRSQANDWIQQLEPGEYESVDADGEIANKNIEVTRNKRTGKITALAVGEGGAHEFTGADMLWERLTTAEGETKFQPGLRLRRKSTQPTGETQNASENTQNAEVHGDVPLQPVEGQQEVPSKVSDEGVPALQPTEGTPPAGEIPEVAKPEASLENTWTRYNDTGEIVTFPDLVNEVEGLIVEGKAPESLQDAVDEYRRQAKEDFEEMAGRNDMDQAEQQFKNAVQSALPKSKEVSTETPTTKATSSQAIDFSALEKAKDLNEVHTIGGRLLVPATTRAEIKSIREAMQKRAAELAAKPEVSQIAPEVTKFSELVLDPTAKPFNKQSNAAGLAVKSVADLDALADLRFKVKQTSDDLFKTAERDETKVNQAVLLGSRAQLPREAIEVATNTGGWIEGKGTLVEKLGERPLDWKTHPEVRDWLRKNADRLKITLPDDFPKTEPLGPPFGAASPSEFPANPGSADIAGLAERVRKRREAAGKTAETVPGQGIAPEASVERGRQLLQTTNPDQVMSEFEATKKLSSDGVAVVRAKAEQLARVTNDTEEKFGTDSDEWRKAFDEESAWAKRTKAMQTEWAKAGHAQQGEVDIDTGTFTGMARIHRDATGKEFTPEQAGNAKVRAKKEKAANESANAAQAAVLDHITNRAKGITDAEKRATDAASKTVREAAARMAEAENKQRVAKTVAEKKVADIEAARAKKLLDAAQKRVRDQAVLAAKKAQAALADPAAQAWDKARSYIEKGMDNFDDIRNKLAVDLGQSVDKVTRLLASDKRAKYLTDDAWRKQLTARELKQNSRNWLISLDVPAYKKWLATVPRALFSLKVGFHGTVALGTHAPMIAFQPRFWESYARNYGKMYRMNFGKAYYERQVQDLVRNPNYTVSQRAGLQNNPHVFEDYTSPDTMQWMGALTAMGNRGYFVLKLLRQDMFDQHWNNLPKTQKIPEVAAAIADSVNHATGVTQRGAPFKGASVAFFAPRLEASRAAWLVVDPLKAADTFFNWKNADPGQKWFAVNQLKEKAWIFGTMGGVLALNAGLLAAMNSKQKINWDDPMKSDWLKFKVGGMTVSYGNAFLNLTRMPARLWAVRNPQGRLGKSVQPGDKMSEVVGEYIRSQLAPASSITADLVTTTDFKGRPLPGSNYPVPKRQRQQGIEPYTWSEYITEAVAPIPVEEAIKEVWGQGMGMSPDQIKKYRKAFITWSFMSGTGGRMTEDPEAQ